MQEVEPDQQMQANDMSHLLSELSAAHDRLFEELAIEYAREPKPSFDSSDALLADRIMRLLSGERVDTSDLNYDLASLHVGVIAEGDEAVSSLRTLAKAVDARLLLVRVTGGRVWAWLGTRAKVNRDALGRGLAAVWPCDLALALGEPGAGVFGWRLTHQQAVAAWRVRHYSDATVVPYGDVALEALTIQDQLLALSLRQFLEPLSAEDDGGKSHRATLSAFFSTHRNISAAAALLGVKRHTVTARLRRAEERLDRPLLSAATPMLELALRLADYETWPADSARQAVLPRTHSRAIG